MANLKLNNNQGNNSQAVPKIKLGGGQQKQEAPNVAPVVDTPQENNIPEDTYQQPNNVDSGMPDFSQFMPEPEPVQVPPTPVNIPISDSKMSSDYEDEDDEEVDDADLSPKELRKKQKLEARKNKNKNRKQKDKSAVKDKKSKGKKEKNKPQTPEEAYAAYKRRKIIVIVGFVLIVVGLITFGTYNTFFKHTLTAGEAAVATNTFNNQTQAQQWDSGVQGYLQANLKSLLEKDTTLGSGINDFSVSNISIEKNEQLSNDIILSFFSADITAGGNTDRIFMTLPLSIEDGEFKLAGRINMTTRKNYTDNIEEVKANPYLDFDSDINDEASAELLTTLDNFLNTGYNAKKEVSDFYTDAYPLNFEGTYNGIITCNVYEEPNALGYNAYATYDVVLPNGLYYTNCIYMEVAKNSSGRYDILRLL